MNAHPTVGRELAKGVGHFAAHALAIMLGLILIVVGIAMGVSIALLPIGVPAGFVGLALLLWGLFGGADGEKLPPYPAQKR